MGRKAADHTGKKFNRLMAVRNTEKKHGNSFVWEWLCDCGNAHYALPSHVISGSTKSCGCLKRESVIKKGDRYGLLTAVNKEEGSPLWVFDCQCGSRVSLPVSAVRGSQKSCGCLKRKSKPSLTHGMSGTPTYVSWQQMRYRCAGKDETSKMHYKDRGISVCERWLIFENFLSDMGERPESTSIERIDNSKGYSPENCVWATQRDQLANTRRTVFVMCDGVKICLKHACEKYGVNYDKVRSRIRRGISAQDAFEAG